MKSTEELEVIKSALQAKLNPAPVYTVIVPLDEEETIFATIYIKAFDRMVLSSVQKIIGSNDILKAVEVFLKNTYVGGDEIELVTGNFIAIRACQDTVFELMTAKKAILKKN